jgi:fused signal recognition particle receptor
MGLFDLFGKKSGEPEKKPATAEKAAEPQTAPSEAEGKGFFSSLKSALKKTSTILNTDIRDLFKREGRLVDDAFLEQLFAILVRTDMGAGPAAAIRDEVKSDFRGRVVHMSDLLGAVKKKMRELLVQPEQPLNLATDGPTVILVVGVNGSGKTTSISKLARYLKEDGKRVILGAGDTFRAAAVEQLSIWAERLGVEIVKGEQGADPAAVAHRVASRAVETNADVCIIDTAGRLQTQSNLMQQLEKIHRVVGKQIPGAPHETLLVLDATAGQNAISQAQGFSQAAKCTGIILAKLDGTAKGGVIVPIWQKFQIPVKFIGLGEKPSDIAAFHVDEFVEAMFEE